MFCFFLEHFFVSFGAVFLFVFCNYFRRGNIILGRGIVRVFFAYVCDKKLSEIVLIFCRCFGVRLRVECIGIGRWHRQKMGEFSDIFLRRFGTIFCSI